MTFIARLEELAKLVGVWRSAKCQRRCDDCDPSFGCFATGARWVTGGADAMCRKPAAERCDGDNHVERCPVELARQDMTAAHDALGAPGMEK